MSNPKVSSLRRKPVSDISKLIKTGETSAALENFINGAPSVAPIEKEEPKVDSKPDSSGNLTPVKLLITEGQKEALRDIAFNKRSSSSEIVRDLIEEYLKKQEKLKAAQK